MSDNKTNPTSNDDDDELLEFDMGDYTPTPPQKIINKTTTQAPIAKPEPPVSNSSAQETVGVVAINETLEPKTKADGVEITDNDTLTEKAVPQSPPSYQAKPAQQHQLYSPRTEHLARLQKKEEESKKTDKSKHSIFNFGHKSSKSKESNKPEKEHIRGLSVSSYSMDNSAVDTELQTVMEEPPAYASDEEDWQKMPTVASYEVYDRKGEKVVVKAADLQAEFDASHHDDQLAGSKYGYTRVTLDDDAKSVTSMDENTDYLFDDDEFNRTPLAQLKATKNMLTEGQRIAYVGLCKLALIEIATNLAQIHGSRRIAKQLSNAQKELGKWASSVMSRLYSHMDISKEEQSMIEQLSAHGVIPSDLSPSLMKFAKVKNPLANDDTKSTITNESTISLQPSSNRNSHESLHVENPEKFHNQETVDIDIRWTLLCDLFLVLISDSVYDARSRTLLECFGNCLEVSKLEIIKFEEKVTNALEIEEASEQTWKETDIMESRRKKALRKKYMYVGMATIGGGLVLGLSAGLLAPVIGAGLAAGFTTIGITGTSGFLAGAGGAAIVTTAGTAMGAKIGSSGMANRMDHVKTFEFRPLHNHKRVNLIITVSGWMLGKEDDVRLPFSTVDPIMGDLYSLYWEPEMLRSMGQTINILATEVLTQSIQQVLGATILMALMSSIQLPMALSKLSYLLDNPWNVSLDRAWASGLILADTLMKRNLGVRPITLVGFSLGARVIYSCLVELSKRNAYGLVQDVFIFGAPVVVKSDQFALARSVVHGRFVNGYSKKDWILGYLFRATSGGLGRVAGLAPVANIYGVENFDCTEFVDGHMGYRKAMPTLLSQLGWEVLSEEFAEIEDPDPEQHRERQRQLIEEFDLARKQMEEEAKKEKKKKSFFGWKKKEKNWWEMYDKELESTHKTDGTAPSARSGSPAPSSSSTTNADGILFDVDAIKNELVDIVRNDKVPKGQFEEYVPTQVANQPQKSESDSIEMSFDPFEDDETERRGGTVAPNQPADRRDSTESRRSDSSSAVKAPQPLMSTRRGRPAVNPALLSSGSTPALVSSREPRRTISSSSAINLSSNTLQPASPPTMRQVSMPLSMPSSHHSLPTSPGSTTSLPATKTLPSPSNRLSFTHDRPSQSSSSMQNVGTKTIGDYNTHGLNETTQMTATSSNPATARKDTKPAGSGFTTTSSDGVSMIFEDDF